MTVVGRIRMEAAMRQLVNTRNSIGSIALSVGYNSQFSFSRLFKKQLGLSPTQYRSKYGYTPQKNQAATVMTAAQANTTFASSSGPAVGTPGMAPTLV